VLIQLDCLQRLKNRQQERTRTVTRLTATGLKSRDDDDVDDDVILSESDDDEEVMIDGDVGSRARLQH